MLDFEWDATKAEGNIAKHRISFETAIRAFDDLWGLDEEDRSAAYGEERRRLIALVGDIVMTLIYVEREGTVRIISARKATRREREDYAEQREAF
jgi:uncharacterized DUF497 family protein